MTISNIKDVVFLYVSYYNEQKKAAGLKNQRADAY